MKDCKVFVISLARAAERRSFMQGQLDGLGLDYEIVDAVDGGALPQSEYEFRLDRKFWHINRGRYLSVGEIGAFLSHYGVWQQIAAGNIPFALVLEDDAILLYDISRVVASVMECKTKWDVCILHAKKAYPHSVLEDLGEGCKLVRFHRRVGGAQAYVITTEAAQKLLSYCSNITAPIDWMYAEWWRNGLDYLAVLPAPIRHGEYGKHESTIETLNKVPRTLGEHFSALRYRIADSRLRRRMLRQKEGEK